MVSVSLGKVSRPNQSLEWGCSLASMDAEPVDNVGGLVFTTLLHSYSADAGREGWWGGGGGVLLSI